MADNQNPERDPAAADTGNSVFSRILLALTEMPEKIAHAFTVLPPGAHPLSADQASARKDLDPELFKQARERMNQPPLDRTSEQAGELKQLLGSLAPVNAGFAKLATAAQVAEEFTAALEKLRTQTAKKAAEGQEAADPVKGSLGAFGDLFGSLAPLGGVFGGIAGKIGNLMKILEFAEKLTAPTPKMPDVQGKVGRTVGRTKLLTAPVAPEATRQTPGGVRYPPDAPPPGPRATIGIEKGGKLGSGRTSWMSRPRSPTIPMSEVLSPRGSSLVEFADVGPPRPPAAPILAGQPAPMMPTPPQPPREVKDLPGHLPEAERGGGRGGPMGEPVADVTELVREGVAYLADILGKIDRLGSDDESRKWTTREERRQKTTTLGGGGAGGDRNALNALQSLLAGHNADSLAKQVGLGIKAAQAAEAFLVPGS